MPHPLSEHPGLGAFISQMLDRTHEARKETRYAYVIESLDLIASIIFVVGSVCFLPEYAKEVDLFVFGCNLFVGGSIVYVLIAGLSLAETVQQKGWSAFEAWEYMGWVFGSVVFLIGTVLYFPDRETCERGAEELNNNHATDVCHSLAQHVNKNSKQFWGTILFISGSSMFVIAIFINALTQTKFESKNERMVAVISFNFLVGSLLFCMGSIAFLPNMGCGPEMVTIGAWMFIIGGGFFVVGSIVSFWRTSKMLAEQIEKEEKEWKDMKDGQGSLPAKSPMSSSGGAPQAYGCCSLCLPMVASA